MRLKEHGLVAQAERSRDRGVEALEVANLQDPPAGGGQNLICLLQRSGNWLFNEYVHPGAQQFHGSRGVVNGGCADAGRVHGRAARQQRCNGVEGGNAIVGGCGCAS